MHFNFEDIADELIVKFEKRLDTNRKAVEKNLGIVFTTLGDHLPQEQRQQLEQIISDILSDSEHSHTALFTQTMNKIVREIRNIVKD